MNNKISMKHKCPICKKVLKPPPGKDPAKQNFYPFCSKRCKLVDLGAWLDAKYKIISKASKAENNDESGQ